MTTFSHSPGSAWSRVFDFGAGTGDYMFLTLSAGGGPIRFAITTSGGAGEQQINGTSTLPLNTWSHVAVTVSGSTGTLYVNGQVAGTNTGMTVHPADLGALAIPLPRREPCCTCASQPPPPRR